MIYQDAIYLPRQWTSALWVEISFRDVVSVSKELQLRDNCTHKLKSNLIMFIKSRRKLMSKFLVQLLVNLNSLRHFVDCKMEDLLLRGMKGGRKIVKISETKLSFWTYRGDFSKIKIASGRIIFSHLFKWEVRGWREFSLLLFLA